MKCPTYEEPRGPENVLSRWLEESERRPDPLGLQEPWRHREGERNHRGVAASLPCFRGAPAVGPDPGEEKVFLRPPPTLTQESSWLNRLLSSIGHTFQGLVPAPPSLLPSPR